MIFSRKTLFVLVKLGIFSYFAYMKEISFSFHLWFWFFSCPLYSIHNQHAFFRQFQEAKALKSRIAVITFHDPWYREVIFLETCIWTSKLSLLNTKWVLAGTQIKSGSNLFEQNSKRSFDKRIWSPLKHKVCDNKKYD